MAGLLYLAELVAYTGAGTETLRYASGQGFITSPAETPANALYDARIKQPAAIRRDTFAHTSTQGRSRVGFGDLVLHNADGALDALLTYGFSGRAITIRQGLPGAAYPSGFTTILAGTMEQVEVQGDVVIVRVRDHQFNLDAPLQATKYAGTNSLPDGLEGTADDLKGKPKPITLGVVKNVPAILVNTSKLIYQVNDGAIQSLDAVYDRGIRLGRDMWIAVGELATLGGSGVIAAVSRDGTEWDLLGSGYVDEPHAIMFGAGLIVMGGAGASAIKTSPDGVVWTARSSQFDSAGWPISTGIINDIGFNGTHFVAVGFTTSGGDAGRISTSTDGITWTTRANSFGANRIAAVAYGASIWVAVAAGAVIGTAADPTSTWTDRANPFTQAIECVAFGNGLFVAGGDAGELATSSNGTSWTARTSGFGASAVLAVAYGNGLWVIAGEGGKIATSPDGITWTLRSSPFSTGDAIGAVHFGDDRFVAVSSGDGTTNGPRVAISLDGAEWFLQPPMSTDAATVIQDLVYIADESTSTNYGSLADLEDDALAPMAGSYRTYLAGGYFRLGSTPAGLITADVTQGATAAVRVGFGVRG